MPTFTSGGLSLRFIDEGRGQGPNPPVLLIHGFASNIETNWVFPGWVKALTDSGRRVIALDNRGHGKSGVSYDPADYGAPVMAEDARRLLDYLNIATADVIGYSMGARITAFLSHTHPDRVRRAIFGGMGASLLTGLIDAEAIASALEVPDVAMIKESGPRMFRRFAEATGSDLKALAACMRSQRSTVTPDMLRAITQPVLVAIGTQDAVAGRPEAIADLMPKAEILAIPGRDHNRAVGDAVFKEGGVAFLSRE